MGKAKRRHGASGAAAAGLCPCGSGRPLAECCGRYLTGGAQHLEAPTPEALMRSRYAAYALGDDRYVLDTWAAETRPVELFAAGEPRPKWMKLEVEGAEEAPDGRTGEVRFCARGRTAMGAFAMKARSRFRREADGRWVYVDDAPEEPEEAIQASDAPSKGEAA